MSKSKFDTFCNELKTLGIEIWFTKDGIPVDLSERCTREAVRFIVEKDSTILDALLTEKMCAE